MDFRDSKTESLGGDTSAVVVENGPVQYIENLKEGETHYMFYGKYMFIMASLRVKDSTCSMASLKLNDVHVL